MTAPRAKRDPLSMKRVLVFDSGVGGLSVARALRTAGLPLTLDYLADAAWLPYGEKSDAALIDRIPTLLEAACAAFAPDAVVMACNTASTIALQATRDRLALPVIGVVPAIKPAAAVSGAGVLGLLATPATVRRPYTDELIARFASHCVVLRHGDTGLVAAAEAKLAGQPVPPGAITAALEGLFSQPGGERIDVVVLACTHFPLLLAELTAAANPAIRFLDSGEAIARRTREVLALGEGQGQTVLDRAAWTGAQARPLALVREGFARFYQINPASPFVLAEV